MRLFLLCHSAIPKPQLSAPQVPASPLLSITSTLSTAKFNFTGFALSGALSLGLLLTPYPSNAMDSSINQLPPVGIPPVEDCREDFGEGGEDAAPERITNESIVEEAWEIVNDSFLDTGRRHWSQESWQQKKKDIMSTKIQKRSKAHEIIRRMLSSLGDPYTRFLSPDEFSKMARYDLSGIGVNLREISGDDGYVKLKVLGLLLDGPAQAAGVRQGDEILAVNGVDVRGKSAFEVSSLLQGQSGTFVTVKVKHGKCGPVQSLEIERQLVARSPVSYRLEEAQNGTSVGYIRLKEFNALARKDIVTAMMRLKDMGASYFVLDLRDNLGGLVQSGIEVSKLFLDQGETVISTTGRDAQFQKRVTSDTTPLVTAPVVVLVNNKTASASEIVASALHDNCKAVLVGEKTYGKGLIQSVFELDDGSGVVVTVGKYVTPNHVDINGNGIEPDYRNLPGWSDVTKHLTSCNTLRKG